MAESSICVFFTRILTAPVNRGENPKSAKRAPLSALKYNVYAETRDSKTVPLSFDSPAQRSSDQ